MCHICPSGSTLFRKAKLIHVTSTIKSTDGWKNLWILGKVGSQVVGFVQYFMLSSRDLLACDAVQCCGYVRTCQRTLCKVFRSTIQRQNSEDLDLNLQFREKLKYVIRICVNHTGVYSHKPLEHNDEGFESFLGHGHMCFPL
jgi:hypothetical protein